jgi:hypothetical protein
MKRKRKPANRGTKMVGTGLGMALNSDPKKRITLQG